jgi:hypothetical protein
MAYEKQVRPATTATPYGLALSSGMGGDYSEHKDTVIIAVPSDRSSTGTSVTKTDDIIPKQWTENVRGIDYSSNAEVVITAPHYRGEGFELSKAFDGSMNTYYMTELSKHLEAKIYFPRPVKINKARISIITKDISYTIVGSVDDINYDIIYTGSSNEELTEIVITNPSYYQIYKICAEGVSGRYHTLYEFQVTEYQIIE